MYDVNIQIKPIQQYFRLVIFSLFIIFFVACGCYNTATWLSVLENHMVLFINLKFVAFTVYRLFFSSKNNKLKIVIEFVLWLI